MSKKIVLSLTALTLAATFLSGCGMSSVAGIQAKDSATTAGKDYGSVTQAQQIASDTLYQYNDLRNQWIAAYDDATKDRIDDQMLVVLSQGLGSVRNSVSGNAGAVGYDSRQVFNIADGAIGQYESLRGQWSMTHDINQQRVISNQMQTIMVNALQQVQSIAPYSPYGMGDDSLSAPESTDVDLKKQAGAKRPTPPKAKLLKRTGKKAK